MFQPANLSSLLDICDELQRDVCQLMYLNETLPFLFAQEVDQEIIAGMSYIMFHVVGSLYRIEGRLKQLHTVKNQVEVLKT